MELLLIGIGTGNPEHLTLQAIRAMNRADLILIPDKGEEKAELGDLRRAICEEVVTNPATSADALKSLKNRMCAWVLATRTCTPRQTLSKDELLARSGCALAA